MWKRSQDYTSWGPLLSRNLCSADCQGTWKEQLGGAAENIKDELGHVYRGLRLVAIHEGKWRGDALLQDENRERRT